MRPKNFHIRYHYNYIYYNYIIIYKVYNFLLFTGKIDLEELIRAFKELGIEIAREEATKLLQR